MRFFVGIWEKNKEAFGVHLMGNFMKKIKVSDKFQ
jgi:hypothetical protein